MPKSVRNATGAGRPRTFDDDAVYTVVARALGRVGYRRLTLVALAAELDCTPQALYKRFGSKRSLLLQYAEWSTRQSEERYRAARAAHDSPLDALRERILMPAEARPDELHDPATLARALTFRLETIDDPEFLTLWRRRDRLLETEMIRTLEDARAAGELVPDCDPARLGQTIHDALAGATVIAAWRTDESLQERFGLILDVALGPYRTGRRRATVE